MARRWEGRGGGAGAVAQAAAVNALSEFGFPPAQAVERALDIIVGPESTPGLDAFDDEAAVADALERVLVAASAGDVVPAAGRADFIRWILASADLVDRTAQEARGAFGDLHRIRLSRQGLEYTVEKAY